MYQSSAPLRFASPILSTGAATPWGTADHVEMIADGIAVVSTPGHGGIRLDTERNALVPSPLRMHDGWYEQDSDSNIVVLTFPSLYEPRIVELARASVKNWYPDLYELAYGETVTLEESSERRKRAFAQRTASQFVVTAAWGDWHERVPAGMVGVRAKNVKLQEERAFLVPTDEYVGTGEFPFVVDFTRHAEWENPPE